MAINVLLLREKAKEIAVNALLVDFKASNGYIANFSRRQIVSFAKIHVESGGVDSNEILNWSVKLKDLIPNVDIK